VAAPVPTRNHEPTRFAVYARYSSDLQKLTSIADQVRLCRERITAQGGTCIAVFEDAEISGFSIRNRPGLQSLLAAAAERRFDAVMAEGLDRIARNLGETDYVFERLAFHKVAIHTLTEGAVSKLHVGFKGTMNALFLSDLAFKVKRGQRGRAEAGFASGGRSFGYALVRELDARGELVRGKRAIDPEQAAVVLRIFREYVAGRTTRQIATHLNRDGIKAPKGGGWNFRFIAGDRQRLNGILCNPLYDGRLVYNRLTFTKNPDTGRKVARVNKPQEWVEVAVPHLRIVPPELWAEAQAIRKAREGRFYEHKRPRRVLSGLVFCGVCGGGFTIAGRHWYGCSSRRTKGTCSNRAHVHADILDARVLDGLREKLMTPEAFKLFADEFRTALKQRREAAVARAAAEARELKDIETRIGRYLAAIEAGADTPEVRARLRELSTRKAALTAEAAPPVKALDLLPSLPELYRRKVENLHEALVSDKPHASTALQAARSLVERVVVRPGTKRGAPLIELRGSIEAILQLAGGATFKSAAAPGC
jgi:site-specific DNA recombinase